MRRQRIGNSSVAGTTENAAMRRDMTEVKNAGVEWQGKFSLLIYLMKA